MLIRFKKNDGTEYPQWEEFKLSQLEDNKYLSLNRGKVIPKTEPKGNYPVYSSSVKNNGLLCCIDKYMFDKELISWSIDGGGNFFYRPPHKYSITNVSGYIDVIALNKINCKFLYYALTTKHAKLHFDYLSKAHPSVIRDLYLVPIPCLKEQQKIADFLSTVDQKIEAQRTIVADYEELKKGTMQKIFNQEIRFKDDDGNEFPEWENKKFGDILYKVNERNNGQFDKTKWISVAKMYYQDPEKVTSNNIDTRTYVMRVGDMAFEGHPNSEFLFGRFVVNDIGDGVISELFPIYRHKNEYVINYWKYAIQVENIMARVYSKCIISSGASSNKISDTDFLKESIYVPCLEEQKKIADYLSALDRKIEAEKKILADLEELKKGLLQAIFNN